ncbi:4-alpha-glucanotransferase [Streptomyces sp. Z26]|uniref:4-alpha-glucanotransferase n=1 Tax=Streptomyces sp. Z26 TaxID=2500177 RepID=UPI000EF17107|nr:4-alpha-glucanotransferase [Streptomyces sp. Z26]RLL66803.1 4-alpha-glucanotransferase [Streptomyces sp. Z26]
MDRLARLASAHGVCTSYEPVAGQRVDVPGDSVVAVLAALGVDASTPDAVRRSLARHERESRRLLPPTVVLRAGSARSTLPALPDGTTLRVDPEDPDAGHPAGPVAATGGTGTRSRDWTPGTPLPLGAHTLHARAPDGRTARATLLVVPDRIAGPRGRGADGRGFGLLTQLYSLLSARSWGMGDLGDLAELAAWTGRAHRADFVQLNPLHAAVPGGAGAADATDPSPYRPSTRRFPDPVHLRVEAVPEYAHLSDAARLRAAELSVRAAGLRDAVLRAGARIDRDAVWALKREALELVRQVPLGPGRRAAYCDFLAARGTALEDHATWCAFAEAHGPDWRTWPAGLDDPRSTRTARARRELLDRVDFHSWLAWLTDEQLGHAQRAARDAGMAVGLVHDLAVGVHPHGADSWAQRDVFAAGMSIGAPPDAFNPRGQDWGLPPWRPDALAHQGYAPYREVLSGLLRHSGALRIDHVMGLFRLWWVPDGRPPTEGAYVRYDAEAMLGALALEAHRAGAAVIGEDLGTVEDGVREELADRGVLGTSVLWFERDHPRDGAARARTAAEPPPLPPDAWRAGCLATVTTHDLPPAAARLSGDHVVLRDRLGLLARPLPVEVSADAAETAGWLGLFRRLGLLPEGVGDEEAEIKAAHRFLVRTPARMLGVWLPDAIGDRRPQNVPGTSGEYPNWRLPVADGGGTPYGLEDLAASPRVHALLDEVRRGLGAAPPVLAAPTPTPAVPSAPPPAPTAPAPAP